MHRSEYENTPNGGSMVRTWIAAQRSFFSWKIFFLGDVCLFDCGVFIHVLCCWCSVCIAVTTLNWESCYSAVACWDCTRVLCTYFSPYGHTFPLPAPSVVRLRFRVLNKCLDCTLRVAEGWRLHSALSILPSIEGKRCLGLSNSASVWWNAIRRFVKQVLWIMAVFKRSAFLWLSRVYCSLYTRPQTVNT